MTKQKGEQKSSDKTLEQESEDKIEGGTCRYCGKKLETNAVFCNEYHLKLFYKEGKEPEDIAKEIKITNAEEVIRVLDYIGVKRETKRMIAYYNWMKFVDMIIRCNGKNWHDVIRPRCRSYVNVGERYLDEYMSSLIAWDIVITDSNYNVTYRGVPKSELVI